ncbi:hypothetical protein MUS_0410 [Bacillus velezensis YAU B9601-Y2]|uniref:Uncharacterized protein n=1 Tax=Bacillus amyloliquefaciens (strain Y2) TaxID=1155777 RepID=I2C1G3_BACAY|nr:hypothetical protein MUS_0410 [Bacillus velezensis YAU B9601-Y2]
MSTSAVFWINMNETVQNVFGEKCFTWNARKKPGWQPGFYFLL